MNLKDFTKQMSDSAYAIEQILKNVTQEQSEWKPSAQEWSILEVVNHLYDEEIADFRERLDMVLHHSVEIWKPNNPEAWVKDRNYNKRDLDKSIANFLNERNKSIAWLLRLSSPDWNSFHEHPNYSKLYAGDLLNSWLTHDYLHLRQIINLKIKQITESAKPFSIKYAG